MVVQAIATEPQRSVYFMIDCQFPNQQQPNNEQENNANGNGHIDGDEEEDNEELEEIGEEEQPISEFWLIPADVDEIDNIYFIMTRFLESKDLDLEKEEESDDEFFDGNDIEHMNINEDERFADP